MSGCLIVAKIAYCITAHNEPEQVARLVNRLETDSDYVYIHFDKVIGEQTFQDWKIMLKHGFPDSNIEVVSKFRCKWGSFGVVDVFLSAMEYYDAVKYDYFLNLTGACYPLKSPESIKKELDKQSNAFMGIVELPFSGWGAHGGMERILNRWYFSPIRFRIPRLRRQLPNNLKPFGGLSWFFLPKDIVSYLLTYIRNNPHVKRFFEKTFCPDEIFFQTLLMNSPHRLRIVNDSRRYVAWKGQVPHPTVLTKADFWGLKNSGKLFARKFSQHIDKEILDMIDRDIEEERKNHTV